MLVDACLESECCTREGGRSVTGLTGITILPRLPYSYTSLKFVQTRRTVGAIMHCFSGQSVFLYILLHVGLGAVFFFHDKSGI